MTGGGSRASASSNEYGLRGRLEQFGLATVLTLLDFERRSGELFLLTSGDAGHLWLRQGRIIRARSERAMRTRKAAVHELLGWNKGRFAFMEADVGDIEDEIDAPTTMLLIEAARRNDERQAAAPGIGRIVVTVSPPA